jgi:hypothetical protein
MVKKRLVPSNFWKSLVVTVLYTGNYNTTKINYSDCLHESFTFTSTENSGDKILEISSAVCTRGDKCESEELHCFREYHISC